MKPEITVRIRTVYGIDKIYPICDKAKVFASIAGTTTLTEQALKHIENLGYEIKIEHRSLSDARTGSNY